MKFFLDMDRGNFPSPSVLHHSMARGGVHLHIITNIFLIICIHCTTYPVSKSWDTKRFWSLSTNKRDNLTKTLKKCLCIYNRFRIRKGVYPSGSNSSFFTLFYQKKVRGIPSLYLYLFFLCYIYSIITIKYRFVTHNS